MALAIRPEAPPLRHDGDAIRVGNTRVLLDLVVRAFQDGATPEEIVRMYDALPLADVYAVVGYYLRHRAEVEAYLAERERGAADVRATIQAAQRDLPDIRQRLLARRAANPTS